MNQVHPSEAKVTWGPLEVTRERRGATELVRPRGALDLATRDTLAAELREAEASDAEGIVLDLTGVDFMDCTGIHLMLDAEARSRRDSGRLHFIRGNGQVDRLVRLTGADEILPFIS
jgi:anti-sigma B factor antagonist